MKKKNKVFSLIIARKGSQRLKGKNIINLKKKPIYHWTVKAALNSKFIEKICFSTDIPEILSSNFKKKIIMDKRPKNLCRSNSTVYDVINLIKKKFIRNSYDILVLLQCTSPFRTSNQIDDAIKFFIKKKANFLVSVLKLNKKYKNIISKEKNNLGFPLKIKGELYIPNGALYICKLDKFKNNFYTRKTLMYEMNDISSIDIDTKHDYLLAKNFEKYLK